MTTICTSFVTYRANIHR